MLSSWKYHIHFQLDIESNNRFEMKFPWSKKDYEYSKYSAPVTNGILRNSKVSAPTATAVRPRNNNVTFRIPRTGSSQLPLNTLCDEFKRTEIIDRDWQSATVPNRRGITSASRPSMSREDSIVLERTRRRECRRPVVEDTRVAERSKKEKRSQKDGKSTTERSGSTSSVASGISADEKDKQKRVPTRKVERRGSSSSSSIASGSSTDEKDKQKRVPARKVEQRGSSSSVASGGSHDKDKPKKTSQKAERRGSASSNMSGGSIISDSNNKQKLSTSITSEVSENSSDTLGSLVNPARLGDLTSDQIESSYGKQGESNGTIDTADVSESSDESLRPRQQQAQLDMLLDEKILAKMSRMKAKERTKA